MSGQPPARTRLRFHFAKRGPLRYISHLDLARIWERLLRRAKLNVVYSQGFNPRPKIQLAAALPLGYASRCEVLDVWLDQPDAPSLAGLRDLLRSVAPEGLEIEQVEEVDERGPALQNLVEQATYEITFIDPVDTRQLAGGVDSLLLADNLHRERRGKEYDLRPLIHRLEVQNGLSEVGPKLVATLSLGQKGTGRPDELLDALGLDPTQARIERVAINFAEPLPDQT